MMRRNGVGEYEVPQGVGNLADQADLSVRRESERLTSYASAIWQLEKSTGRSGDARPSR